VKGGEQEWKLLCATFAVSSDNVEVGPVDRRLPAAEGATGNGGVEDAIEQFEEKPILALSIAFVKVDPDSAELPPPGLQLGHVQEAGLSKSPCSNDREVDGARSDFCATQVIMDVPQLSFPADEYALVEHGIYEVIRVQEANRIHLPFAPRIVSNRRAVQP
jgi:hypothetical protein